MRDSGSAVARPPAPAAAAAWVVLAALIPALVQALAPVSTRAAPLPVARPADAAPAAVPAPAPAPAPIAVPLPAPRPEEDGPPLPPPSAGRSPGAAPREAFGPILPPVLPPTTPAPPEPDLACGPLLTSGDVVARAAAPVAGPDGCGIASPVTLEAVVLRGGRRVPLVPPALMRCDFARAFADWLRDDVAPATAAEGDLLGVLDAAAYACRPRNAVAGGRLSEHGRGDAIDLLAFRFARRTVGLKGSDARDAIAALRASACARFATVLGPGSDRYHEADLHIDLARRRNGFRVCQWDLP